MLCVVGWIFFEAVSRIMTPEPVSGLSVMAIAAVGLVINILVAWSLSRDRKNMNTRAALLHVMGDLLGSVAAIVAGAVIYFGGPTIADPILSLVVCCLLLHATWEILRDSTRVLLDSVPEGVNYFSVGRTIEAIPGVNRVHDLARLDDEPRSRRHPVPRAHRKPRVLAQDPRRVAQAAS